MLGYKYRENQKIKSYLARLNILRQVFSSLPSFPDLEDSLRRESLLHSSIFSARIEGNPLTPAHIHNQIRAPKKDLNKIEIFNLLRAYRYIDSSRANKVFSTAFILRLHLLTMRGLSFDCGHFRHEPWAVFNQAGVAVYIAPSPAGLKNLMNEYINIVNTSRFSVPVTAAVAQFLFEKIHPFADGNGRVGRLVSAYLLKVGKYGMRGLVPLEVLIDEHREQYYEVLEPTRNVTPFVEFFLKGLIFQIEIALKKFKQSKIAPEDALLPRRREILEILKDHPLCSFDFISRRFPAVNPKTLHYDLLKLQEGEYVKKIGKTRGSVYRAS
ncbi:Fic family protein [Candidatus Collierbacteria bacterium]|nr:Fic family protein [Candidatus Collierbacteria bacterium]